MIKNQQLQQQPEENDQNEEPEKVGLVLFENKEDAYSAIKELNGKIIDSSLKPLLIHLYLFKKNYFIFFYLFNYVEHRLIRILLINFQKLNKKFLRKNMKGVI